MRRRPVLSRSIKPVALFSRGVFAAGLVLVAIAGGVGGSLFPDPPLDEKHFERLRAILEPADNGCDNYLCGCASCGCGDACACGLSDLGAIDDRNEEQFVRRRVELLSRVPLSSFGASISRGTDCWGYTSPSGREYALMCTNQATGVVDITDPTMPVVLSVI